MHRTPVPHGPCRPSRRLSCTFGLLALALALASAATGATPPPPWRTPGWEEGAPEAAPPSEPVPAPATPAAADGAAQLFGRRVAHESTQALIPKAHAGRVCPGCLLLRPDGQRVVLADNGADPPRVAVFALYPNAVLEERGYVLGQLSPIGALALSADAAVLATAAGAAGEAAERSLRVWDAKALNQRTPALKLADAVPTSLAVSLDGRHVVVGDADGGVTWFRNRFGRQRGQTTRAHGAPVGALAFSPDSRVLYTTGGAGDPLRAWAAEGHKAVALPALPALAGAAPSALHVGVGGASGALVGDREGKVVRVDLKTGATVWTAEVPGAVRRLRVVAGAEVAVVASEGASAPTFLALASGEALPGFRARHDVGLLDATYDPRTGLVALAHADGTLEYWRVEGAPEPRRYE